MSEAFIKYIINILIVEYYRQSRQGITAYDVELDGECMFFIDIFSQLHDNPMLCECASHVGLQGNYFCPRCKAGGTKDFKSSDDGFVSLFQVRIHILYYMRDIHYNKTHLATLC